MPRSKPHQAWKKYYRTLKAYGRNMNYVMESDFKAGYTAGFNDGKQGSLVSTVSTADSKPASHCSNQ